MKYFFKNIKIVIDFFHNYFITFYIYHKSSIKIFLNILLINTLKTSFNMAQLLIMFYFVFNFILLTSN